MIKIITKIFIIISLLFLSVPVFATWNLENIKTDNLNNNNNIDNDHLEKLSDDKFFKANTLWNEWIKWLLFNIWRDLRIIIYGIIALIWIIIVIRLIFWNNTEEEVKKFKTFLIWWSIWIILMQISFVFYDVLFDKSIDGDLWDKAVENIIQNFIDLLLLLTSFIFIAIMIYAFYMTITAGWDEEKAKKWKTTIIQALIWFIVIKASDVLIKNTYEAWCTSGWINVFWVTRVCENITENAKLIITLINWLNTFVVLVVVILTIYAWFLIMTWTQEEDKQKKAKSILLYIAVWILILFANYLILTFFIKPETPIW